MARKQQGKSAIGSTGYRGIGYGRASPVVMAQMHGEMLPHIERQLGDRWDMEPTAPE